MGYGIIGFKAKQTTLRFKTVESSTFICRQGKAVFGVLGPCIRKNVSQWSEP